MLSIQRKSRAEVRSRRHKVQTRAVWLIRFAFAVKIKFMKTILSVLVLLSLNGCGKQISVDPSSNSPTAVEYHGVCQLMNSAGAAVLCIDFPADSTTNATSCETAEKQRYAGVGVTGAEYVGVSNPASTSCALTNPGLS